LRILALGKGDPIPAFPSWRGRGLASGEVGKDAAFAGTTCSLEFKSIAMTYIWCSSTLSRRQRMLHKVLPHLRDNLRVGEFVGGFDGDELLGVAFAVDLFF